MAIEIVDLPIKNGDFPVMLVYQRVKPPFSYGFPMVFLWVNLPALGVHDYGTMEPSTNVVPRRIQLNDAAAIPQQRRQRMSRGSARELIALSREDHIWGKTGDLKNKSKKGKSKS